MDLVNEYKKSWEEAEEELDIMYDYCNELENRLDDAINTITYYDDILRNMRKKLRTINENKINL